MSSTVVTQPVLLAKTRPELRRRGFIFLWITTLTAAALLIHGYHPYSEDGGIYAAGVERLLNPSLFPYSLPFVEQHLHLSLFAPLVALCVRTTHLSLPITLLLVHLVSIWMMLFSVWLLASRCFQNVTARMGAVMLTAAWLTLPVAGTSIILMDPYLTARSISLPCSLLALSGVIDLMLDRSASGRLHGTLLCLFIVPAMLVHPLMAGYGIASLLLLGVLLMPQRTVRLWGTLLLCGLAIVLAAVLQMIAQPESSDYRRVAITRYYWFLSQWHGYEILGLIAPLLILGAVWVLRRNSSSESAPQGAARRALALMAICIGCVGVLISLLFVHEGAATHLVARLQPLRCFQIVYVLMILFLGALLGEFLLRRSALRWIGAFAVLGGVMFFAQRAIYPSSTHVEWPGRAPENLWHQAFLWISRNTPQNALFALDSDYISKPGEDAQCFRAIALRSSLPDYSKDGGEASINPSLATLWATGETAQFHLSERTDAERQRALLPLHVDWVVLQRSAGTRLNCPYENVAVKVCSLQ